MKQSNSVPEGFKTLAGFDPAEDNIGPFYYEQSEVGLVGLLQAETKHGNANGAVHGGVLMALADFTLCMVATDAYAVESCVTVNFNSDFIAAAPVGENLLCSAEITRKTRSMVFLRGQVSAGDTTVLSYSGIVKRLLPRD